MVWTARGTQKVPAIMWEVGPSVPNGQASITLSRGHDGRLTLFGSMRVTTAYLSSPSPTE